MEFTYKTPFIHITSQEATSPLLKAIRQDELHFCIAPKVYLSFDVAFKESSSSSSVLHVTSCY